MGYDTEKINALKMPSGMNQGALLVNSFQTLGTFARSKGMPGGSFAAAKIKTGAPHEFVPVSTTSANP